MKKILLALITFTSINSFALEPKDPFYVCNRVNSGPLKTRCLSAISGQYVDGLAAAACDRIQSAEGTVQCMEAIVNLEFDSRAVVSCDSITDATNTIQCLRQVGQPVRHGGGGVRPPTNDFRMWAKEMARYGLQQLDNGNIYEARRALEDILRN
ncbi:hypothetical protein [Bdellovibrio sp. HCB337]|uniref:hypothetical protein n=1 Tax=Bdellovibrio sp. HCB337 TaxID=3394358 RepID=UPI0039A51CDC